MIQTGKKPITMMTLLAILSISLVVNLPGLAVTPMLGTLSKVFPGTTQLEKQMLTVLPNLLIIPFVLLSGKLSLTRHKIAIVVTGLVIFTACAIGYLFADSMMMLIAYSCLLGCGAGLLVPLSSGLIADTFAGKYRMAKMGIKSGISNSSLVVATFVVGWLSHGNWHLPFVVYLVALIPLVLSLWLRGIRDEITISPEERNAVTSGNAPTGNAQAGTSPWNAADNKVRGGFFINRIWGLMGVYSFITFATISITYFCPFLIEKKDWGSTLTGTVTALFFLFMLIPGYSLPWFVKILRKHTFIYCGMIMAAGLALFSFVEESWAMCIGASLAGLGYGICQPIIYDKASHAVTSESRATLSLAFVLSANYTAIVATPFIIDGLRALFHIHTTGTFAFQACFILLVAYTILAFILRRRFAFSISKDYYS